MRWKDLLASVRKVFSGPPKPLGARGEDAAARYLRKQGCVLIARSLDEKFGEIDLIVVERRTIVFVEVKTRRSETPDHPAEAVGPDKQRRLTRAALGFLKRRGLLDYPARFDVVTVLWPDAARRPRIEHFRGAFEAQGVRGMY